MLIYRFHTWGKAAVNSNISNWFSEFQSPNVYNLPAVIVKSLGKNTWNLEVLFFSQSDSKMHEKMTDGIRLRHGHGSKYIKVKYTQKSDR